jgi:hypothetical protein
MSIKRKVILAIAIIVVVAGAVLAVWWFKFRPAPATPDTGQTQESWKVLPIGDLTTDELVSRSKQDTGYTPDELKNQTATTTTFKDFSQAYAAAQVLGASGDYQKSLAAYKIAEQKAGSSNLSEDFYNDFSHGADQAGDYALGTSLLQKEIDFINASNLSANEKSSSIDLLNSKLETRKAEGLGV